MSDLVATARESGFPAPLSSIVAACIWLRLRYKYIFVVLLTFVAVFFVATSAHDVVGYLSAERRATTEVTVIDCEEHEIIDRKTREVTDSYYETTYRFYAGDEPHEYTITTPTYHSYGETETQQLYLDKNGEWHRFAMSASLIVTALLVVADIVCIVLLVVARRKGEDIDYDF